MASWSEWFEKANTIEFPLKHFLPINLTRDLDRLYSSRLPVLDRLLVDGRDYSPQKVAQFCDRHSSNWFRIYPNNGKGERYYKLDMNSRETLAFIKGLNVDISQFGIQLFEYVTNAFGGNIIVDNERKVIEIAEGSQDRVGKSLNPFFHGSISQTGCLSFYEKRVPHSARLAARNTLKYLKLARGEYLQGYFEFIVSDKGRPFFLDYKTLFLEPLRRDSESRTSD